MDNIIIEAQIKSYNDVLNAKSNIMTRIHILHDELNVLIKLKIGMEQVIEGMNAIHDHGKIVGLTVDKG